MPVSNEKYICKICGFEVRNRAGIARHVKKHGYEYIPYLVEYENYEVPKCPICGKDRKKCSGVWFTKTCGSKKCNVEIRKKTCIEKYGVDCIFKVEEKKNKIKETNLKRYGSENPFGSKSIQEKIKKTNIQKYGVENPNQSEKIREKSKRTNLKRYGVSSPMMSKSVQEKYASTCMKKYGVSNSFKSEVVKDKIKKKNMERLGTFWPMQSPEILRKRNETMKKRYGYEYSSNVPEIHKKIMSKRRQSRGGYDSNAELNFARFLEERDVNYKSHCNLNNKEWDFVLFENDVPKCVIEIDGEWFHGILSDVDGKHVQGKNDHTRFRKVPTGVNFVVVDSLKVKEENIDEILKVAFMDHEKFIQNILNNLPSEFPFPSFDEKRMLKDWKHLCEWESNPKQMLCNSVILNFCRSIWSIGVDGKTSPIEVWNDKTLLKKLVREHYIYWSKFSSKQISDGFNDCDPAPRAPFTQPSAARYEFSKSEQKIVEEELDVGRMLGACSLGLEYHGYSENKELIKEGASIVEFLGLNSSIEFRRSC